MMPRLFSLLLTLLVLASCGSGGGGDSFDPLRGADVDLAVEPKTIDVGNRAQVTVFISRINPNGVVVVLRYSAGALAFSSGSAELEVDGDRVQLNPTFGPANRRPFDSVTFFLPRSAFADENAGTLTLTLRGEKRDTEARIEVDEFAHNPAIPPEQEFSLRDPDFTAEDIEEIDVVSR